MSQPIRLKDHEKDARLVRNRVVVGAVAIVLLICVLIARLYYLQIIQYDYHSTLSENNRCMCSRSRRPAADLRPQRVIVADNRPSFSLSMTRERAGNWQEVLDTIVEVLDLTTDDRACSRSACAKAVGRSSRCRSCSNSTKSRSPGWR